MGKHSIAEAQAHLSELIDRAQAGEPVTIVREDGEPIAELLPRTPKAVSEEQTVAGRSPRDDDDPHGLKWLAERRKRFPKLTIDVTELVSQMRDEDWR